MWRLIAVVLASGSGLTMDLDPVPTDAGVSADAGISADAGHPADSQAPADAGRADVPTACVPTEEVCDGIDDDCDGTVDEGATGCPCTHRIRNRHSYLFCTSEVPWTEARDACRAVGHELVTIDEEAENIWLHERTETLARPWWWIGASGRTEDTVAEDVYVWIATGVPLSSGYTNWAMDEPNNFMGWEQDCGAMYLPAGIPAPWHDLLCGASYAFVCEAGP